MLRCVRLLTLTLLCSAPLVAPPAEALPSTSIIIDTFDVAYGPTTALSDTEGYRDSRDASVSGENLILSTGNDLVVIALTATPLVALVQWPGTLPANTLVDLVGSGNTGFQLDVGPLTGVWDATIFAASGSIDDVVMIPSLTANTSYFVAFDAFLKDGVDPVNFMSIDQLQLTLRNTSATGDLVVIGQLAAVPEPGTAALLGLGLLGLGTAAPRRRAVA